MNKTDLIKVINKFSGVVGYDVPDLQVHRNFMPNETKDISYEELEKLSFLPGGEVILREYLEITDPEVANQLLHKKPEPEYYYSKQDVKKLMEEGSLDQFLDCLDFAPSVIIDVIKDLAVSLPLNDVAKREAIKEKLGFDVTRAIEIKNTKLDGQVEAETAASSTRRVAAPEKAAVPAQPSGRRYQPSSKK